MTGLDATSVAGAAFLRAVGRRLRLARLTAELTQEELGMAAGVSRSFVSVLEHGTAGGVDVLRLCRLAAVVGMSLLELLDVPYVKGDRWRGPTRW